MLYQLGRKILMQSIAFLWPNGQILCHVFHFCLTVADPGLINIKLTWQCAV